MTTPSKIKPCFERLLSEIYARWPRENNQQVCIDFSNQDQREISLGVKNVVGLTFMYSIIKIFHL